MEEQALRQWMESMKLATPETLDAETEAEAVLHKALVKPDREGQEVYLEVGVAVVPLAVILILDVADTEQEERFAYGPGNSKRYGVEWACCYEACV